MQIAPSQNIPQAFGSTLNSSAPAAQTRQPTGAEPAAPQAPNVNQLADAAPRAEAPARPGNDSQPPAQTATQQDRPGSRLNLLT